MRRQPTADPFINFKQAKQAELERQSAIEAANSNVYLFFCWMSISGGAALLWGIKALGLISWENYSNDFMQALLGYSQQRYDKKMTDFSAALSSAFSINTSMLRARHHALSNSVSECLQQVGRGGVADWVQESASVSCYSNYMDEMIQVFERGKSVKVYNAIDQAYRSLVVTMGKSLADLEIYKKLLPLGELVADKKNPNVLRNLQQEIFKLLPRFFNQQETLEGKLAFASNGSIVDLVKSAGVAFTQNKSMLLFNLTLLLVAGFVSYGGARWLSSYGEQHITLAGDDSDDTEVIKQYREETTKQYRPASIAVSMIVSVFFTLLYAPFVFIAAVRPDEEKVGMATLMLLSYVSVELTPEIYRPVVGMFSRNEEKQADKVSEQLKAYVQAQGWHMDVDIEKVTTQEKSAYFLTLSYSGRRLTASQANDMMRFVKASVPNSAKYIQKVDGKLIVSTAVNLKALQAGFNAYWKQQKSAFAVLDALREIGRKIYRHESFKISELPYPEDGQDRFGICHGQLLTFEKAEDINIEKLQLIFPDSKIEMDPRNALQVLINGTSSVNRVELNKWLQEVSEQRLATMKSRYVDDHRPHQLSQLTVRRRMTSASRATVGAGGDAFVVATPAMQAIQPYPDEFDFTDTHGATLTAHLVEGRRGAVPAYVAILIQAGPTYRHDVVEAMTDWVSPARWGATVRSIQGADLEADCTRPGATRKQLKHQASFEVRRVKKELSDHRGICRREGMFTIPDRPDLPPVELHYCVDVKRHASKGRGFR